MASVRSPGQAVGAGVSLRAVKLPDPDLAFLNVACVRARAFDRLLQDAGLVSPPRCGFLPCDVNGFILNVGNADLLSGSGPGALGEEEVGLSSFQRADGRCLLDAAAALRPLKQPTALRAAAFVQCKVTPLFTDQLASLEDEVIEEECRRVLVGGAVTCGQSLALRVKALPLKLVVSEVLLPEDETRPKGTSSSSSPSSASVALVAAFTQFIFSSTSTTHLIVRSRRIVHQKLFASSFNFEELGIGGLDKEFEIIFRRAFASRLFPPSIVEELGIRHVRGLLLFGPPGTGKTLIARQLGKVLHAREPKIVNGPEILNKFVGQSEENIRSLFKEADAEYKKSGEDSSLHIIIFDELDAICKQRGSTGGSTGVNDSVVNQLLSKIDGVDALNNILLIGMTNRLDLIDEALLRPGRLEVHVEIGLPDEFGRAQILEIHTKKLKQSNRLAQDVDLPELAERTKNFSGAEIEGLVRAALSYAFERNINPRDLTKAANTDEIIVCRGDFEKAMDEVKPVYGVQEDQFERCLRGGIIRFGPSLDRFLDSAHQLTKVVSEGDTAILSVLFYGESGCGKTALAAHVAQEANFPCMKLISPASLLGFSEAGKIAHINGVFNDAYKSPLSLAFLLIAFAIVSLFFDLYLLC
eukprot:GHVT01064750.1.p1 GENE.GHVT01064750.1~~GHVT01064750.1.p1  ORF type:complete len:640 (-),score=159.32 GHVT01064750.1:987-2906(-)